MKLPPLLLLFLATAPQTVVTPETGLGQAKSAEHVAAPPFSLTITTPQSAVKVGKPIFINIAMTNTSDHVIDTPSVWMAGFDLVYGFEVQDSTGAPVPWRAPNTVAFVDDTKSGTLAPGKTVKEDVRIDRFYKMTRPGPYQVQVRHYISMENPQGNAAPKYDAAKGQVWSNKITVTLVPANATDPQ